VFAKCLHFAGFFAIYGIKGANSSLAVFIDGGFLSVRRKDKKFNWHNVSRETLQRSDFIKTFIKLSRV
jgi:hypothetical protein